MGALTAVPLGEHDELARLRGEVKHLRKTNEILSQGRLGVVNKGIKYHAAHLIMNEMSNGRFNWGKIIPEHDVRRPDGTVLAHENYDSWVRPPDST